MYFEVVSISVLRSIFIFILLSEICICGPLISSTKDEMWGLAMGVLRWGWRRVWGRVGKLGVVSWEDWSTLVGSIIILSKASIIEEYCDEITNRRIVKLSEDWMIKIISRLAYFYIGSWYTAFQALCCNQY